MKSKILLILFICLILIGCNNNENNKYVFEADENIQYIFYYKDNIVTDFKIYVNFYDEQTANNSLEQYKKIVENDINVEEVIVDGKYIVIDYKKGYVKQNFGTDSLDIIKSMEVIDESN